MNALLKEIYHSRKVHTPTGKVLNPFPASIPYHEGQTLYNIVRTTGAARTLEIGMAYGLSTLFICQALHDNGGGQHTVLDPFQRTDWQSIGLGHVQQSGLEPYMQFCEDYSYNALPRFVAEQRRFELIFIDGSHRFDETLLEFFYADRLLSSNGYLVFDDVRLPAVRKVLAFVVRNTGYQVNTRFITPASLVRRPLLWVGQQLRQHAQLSLASLLLGKSRRYCILQKTTDEQRPWDYYRHF